jgi:hypothetical protein
MVKWPNGKSFAFTIVDDTDEATVNNVKPIYDLLYELGFKTTKTVWLFHQGMSLVEILLPTRIMHSSLRNYQIKDMKSHFMEPVQGLLPERKLFYHKI